MKSFIMKVNLTLDLIFKMRYEVFIVIKFVIKKSASLTVFLSPISDWGLEFFKDGGQIYTSSHFVVFG